MKRRTTEIDELSCGIDLPHAMTGVDEIHLSFRVDDNRRAWMRVGRLGTEGGEETDEGEREQSFPHYNPAAAWPPRRHSHLIAFFAVLWRANARTWLRLLDREFRILATTALPRTDAILRPCPYNPQRFRARRRSAQSCPLQSPGHVRQTGEGMALVADTATTNMR